MPRKRIIDPSIWTDPDFVSLSFRQRLLFIGMFSSADDDGRLKADPRGLKMLVFPGDDIPFEEVDQDLDAISKSGMAHRYTNNEKEYVYLPNWSKYQKVKYPTPSKLPPPPSIHINEFNQSSNQSSTKAGGKKGKSSPKIPGSLEENSPKIPGSLEENSPKAGEELKEPHESSDLEHSLQETVQQADTKSSPKAGGGFREGFPNNGEQLGEDSGRVSLQEERRGEERSTPPLSPPLKNQGGEKVFANAPTNSNSTTELTTNYTPDSDQAETQEKIAAFRKQMAEQRSTRPKVTSALTSEEEVEERRKSWAKHLTGDDQGRVRDVHNLDDALSSTIPGAGGEA